MNPRPAKKAPKNKKEAKKIKEIFVSEPYQYEKIQKIDFESIVNQACSDGACFEFAEGLKKFVEIFGTNFDKLKFSVLMEEIVKHYDWVKWLIDNGFIRQETTGNISVGDRFTIGEKRYILSETPNCQEVMLICLEDGTSLHGCSVDVDDFNHIKDQDILYDIFDLDYDEDGDYVELDKILRTRIPKGTTKQVSKKFPSGIMNQVYIVMRESYGDFDIPISKPICASLDVGTATSIASDKNDKRTKDELKEEVKYTVISTKLK
jgi:hypothetical protein